MIRPFLKFLFENDRSSMLPMVGDCLLKLFTLWYNFCFELLLKSLSWLIPETDTLKTLIAFASFFIAVYTLLYSLKKIIILVRTFIWFLGVKVCKLALGSFVSRMKNGFKIGLESLKKQMRFLMKGDEKDFMAGIETHSAEGLCRLLLEGIARKASS